MLDGFSHHQVDLFVKFGGSILSKPDVCRAAVRQLEELHSEGMTIMVYPGGGPTDNTIEQLDSVYVFDDTTIHHACALAFDQTGLMLCDRTISRKFVPCETLEKAARCLSVSIAVLIPSRMIVYLDPFTTSRNTSSDSMAAWFAHYVNARKFIVLTDIDGVFQPGHVGDMGFLYRDISATELARHGHTSVDACFANYVNSVRMDCWVLNADAPERIRDVMAGGTPIGTRIRPVE
jgi:5-(aminomethyl)-3-furanmethanol phosphate kinase